MCVLSFDLYGLFIIICWADMDMVYNRNYSYSTDAENLLNTSKHITICLVYKKLLSNYFLVLTICRSTACPNVQIALSPHCGQQGRCRRITFSWPKKGQYFVPWIFFIPTLPLKRLILVRNSFFLKYSPLSVFLENG